MKTIKESSNEHKFPRHAVKSVEARKRDLLVRITDWTDEDRERGEPAYDVEIYIGGVYDFDESEVFSLRKYGTKKSAKTEAVKFARGQIQKLL